MFDWILKILVAVFAAAQVVGQIPFIDQIPA